MTDERRRRNVQITTGSMCFLAGLTAMLTACFVSVGLWISGSNLHPWISTVDTVLFLVGLTLIILAGVYLDKSERGRKK